MAKINTQYDPETRRLYPSEAFVENVAAIDTADATDSTTAAALANANKAALNDLLAALKAAEVMVADET